MRILRVTLRLLGRTAAAIVMAYVLWTILSSFAPSAAFARIAWLALVLASLVAMSWLEKRGKSAASPPVPDPEDDDGIAGKEHT
jgi:hypothetical protein